MARIVEKCQNCGREVGAHVGQTWRHGGLRWSMSFRCPSCGSAYEADGGGETPQDIRAAVLTEEGEWELHVPDPGAPKICIAKTLRQELSLSLTQSAALIRNLPGVVATGTEAEMQWLAQRVHAESGYRAEVWRKPPRRVGGEQDARR